MCNGHLPTNSIYTRFLWVIRFLVRNHFYVVLDNQLNIDSTALDDPVRWVGLWEQLLTDVVADPVSKARVMVDILNEPDSRDLQCAPHLEAPDTLWHASWSASPMSDLRSASKLVLRCPHSWALATECVVGNRHLGCACGPRSAALYATRSALCGAPGSLLPPLLPPAQIHALCLSALPGTHAGMLVSQCQGPIKQGNDVSLVAGGRGARRPRQM